MPKTSSFPRSAATRAAPRARAVPGVVLVALLGLLGACGNEGDDGSADSGGPTSDSTPLTADAPFLELGSFVSTEVVGHDMVEDSTIQLGFADDTMSVWAGCNTMFGAFTVEDGVLRWSHEPASTMIGCEKDLAA